MALNTDTDVLDELSSLMEREFFPSNSSPEPSPPPTPYIYHRIPNNRRIIRLLTLFPSESSSSSPPFSQPLRGRLDYAPLAFDPTYDALSYTWGSMEKPFVLELVHSSSSSSSSPSTSFSSFLPITTSVDVALRRLRENPRIRRKGERGWKLWIDAICIDQSDDVEKSGQVALMSEIFSAASRVLCWIGEDEVVLGLDDDDDRDGGNRGRGMARATLELLFKLGDVSFAEFGLTRKDITDEFMVSRGLPVKGHGTWTAVTNFFMRPWFRRGWVLQEVFHAREAIVVCGDEDMDLGYMTAGVEAVFDYDLLGWGSETTLSFEDLTGLMSFRTLLHQKIQRSPEEWLLHELGYFVNNDGHRAHRDAMKETLRWGSISLSRIVENFRATMDTLGIPYRHNPNIARAFLGPYSTGPGSNTATSIRIPLHMMMRLFHSRITTDPKDQFFALLSMSSDEDEPSLRVDYTESFESIQLRYARYFLLESRDPQGMQFKNLLACAGTSTRQVSADAPSWIPNFDIIRSESGKMMLNTLSVTSPRYYNAAAGSESKHRPIADRLSEIIVVGSLLDVISHVVSQPLAQDDHGPSDFYRYFAEIDRIVARVKAYPIPSSESRVEVMWRTLIGNMGLDLGPASKSYGSLYHQHRLRLKADTVDDPYDVGWGLAAMNDWVKRWMAIFLSGYQLCETKTGFIGLAPRGAEIGDSICIVLGEGMPLLLRPSADEPEKCHLVGSCYVHGIMQGEAMMSKTWMERDIHLV